MKGREGGRSCAVGIGLWKEMGFVVVWKRAESGWIWIGLVDGRGPRVALVLQIQFAAYAMTVHSVSTLCGFYLIVLYHI